VDQEHPTIDASRNANGATGVTAAGEDAVHRSRISWTPDRQR
jgi:hypothetical protein